MRHSDTEPRERRYARSFGPLAEALRKRGELAEALQVVQEGLAREPSHLPGQLVLSRICVDQHDWAGADSALRAALAIDPAHPVVLEAMAALAEVASRHAEVTEEPDESLEIEEPADVMLTESLAGLYRRQGHLEKAVEVYDVLAQRAPDNEALSARREALREELLNSRPHPFDSALSRGTSVRTWLAGIGTAGPVPPAPPPGEPGYDAFFKAPATPSHRSGDFSAFQAWLKEMER